jgi:hypothetical protein
LREKTDENEHLAVSLGRHLPELEEKFQSEEKKSTYMKNNMLDLNDQLLLKTSEIASLKKQVFDLERNLDQKREIERNLKTVSNDLEKHKLLLQDKEDEVLFLKKKIEGLAWADRDMLEKDNKSLREIVEKQIEEIERLDKENSM